MGTLPQHNLSGLLEDDCWSLFKERAFGPDRAERPNLVALGKEIVKKCGGVPLAVKSLGALMRFKDQEDEWLSVRDSELWNLPLGENSILPALRLSYSHLPSKFRQCFAYCALFPKGDRIEKKELIHLWMANGFIASSGKQELEDIGNEICNELCWRSFLVHVKKDYFDDVIRFSMHDLVHDLAQSIMEEECHLVGYQCPNVISKKVVHVSVNTDFLKSFMNSNALYGFDNLRTIYLVPPGTISQGNAFNFSCDFSRFTSLRALSARWHNGKKLSSISHLKHLRYLKLSHFGFVKLPESICRLVNMQTLILEACYSLLELPKRMQRLKNLWHLYLNHCHKLSQMPPRIGQITCLQTLTLFIVGKRKGYHLAELKDLNLGGELHIKYLQRVCNPLDAKEANLLGKQNLRRLTLSWEQVGESELLENAEEVLEALEPPRNLEHLVVEGYKGAHFPLWLNDQNLSKVVCIELMECSNCVQLPSLGKLPFLQYLRIDGMTQVLYIDHDIQGGLIGRFPSLKELTIARMPRLLGLSIEDGKELFPCLTNLVIDNCHKFTLPCLPSLKDLRVSGCSDATLRSISDARHLKCLSFDGNDESIYLPRGMLQNLTSLHSVTIQNFSKLKGLPTELQQLSSLRSLNLFNCPELVALPEGIKRLSSLQHLTISGAELGVRIEVDSKIPTVFHPCTYRSDRPASKAKLAVLPEVLRHIPALQSFCISSYPDLALLPDWLGDLTSLQSLYIYYCPKLSSLPASIQSLSNLQKLEIYYCPELVKRCEKETGEDWYKVAHIPMVSVELEEKHTKTSCCI